MTKDECERAIRALCHKWRDARALSDAQLKHPSFQDFLAWLNENGFSRCLSFRSTIGAGRQAELWFDQECKLWCR